MAGSSVPTRQPLTGLVWCAATALGVLFVGTGALRDPALLPERGGVFAAHYLLYLVPPLVLVLWRLRPDRSGPWLLLVGAVCALPMTVVRVVPDAYQPWMYEPLGLAAASAPICALVGLLAVATGLWHAGLRTAAVVLIGAAMVVQPLGPVVTGSTLQHGADLVGLNVVLVLLAVAGGAGAVRLSPGLPAVVPAGWRVIAAGGLAAASQVLYLVLLPDLSGADGPAGALGDYHLRLGLFFLAVGLATGVLAGTRALVAAAAVGLLLGAFGALISPSVEVLSEMVAVAVVAVVVSLGLGCAAAASRQRALIGVGGIGVVVAGLLVIFTLFAGDAPLESYEEITRVLTPVLLVVAVVAAVAAVASVGAVLAPPAAAPPVLAGVAAVFSLAVIHLTGYASLATHGSGEAPLVGVLPPVMIGLTVAAALVALLTRRSDDARGTVEDAL